MSEGSNFSTSLPELVIVYFIWGFPHGSVVKNPPDHAGDAGDAGSIPGSGRSPGGGNGNPLQFSCLENPMDRGAWRAKVHEVTKSQTQLSDWAPMKSYSNTGTHCDIWVYQWLTIRNHWLLWPLLPSLVQNNSPPAFALWILPSTELLSRSVSYTSTIKGTVYFNERNAFILQFC